MGGRGLRRGGGNYIEGAFFQKYLLLSAGDLSHWQGCFLWEAHGLTDAEDYAGIGVVTSMFIIF